MQNYDSLVKYLPIQDFSVSDYKFIFLCLNLSFFSLLSSFVDLVSKIYLINMTSTLIDVFNFALTKHIAIDFQCNVLCPFLILYTLFSDYKTIFSKSKPIQDKQVISYLIKVKEFFIFHQKPKTFNILIASHAQSRSVTKPRHSSPSKADSMCQHGHLQLFQEIFLFS